MSVQYYLNQIQPVYGKILTSPFLLQFKLISVQHCFNYPGLVTWLMFSLFNVVLYSESTYFQSFSWSPYWSTVSEPKCFLLKLGEMLLHDSHYFWHINYLFKKACYLLHTEYNPNISSLRWMAHQLWQVYPVYSVQYTLNMAIWGRIMVGKSDHDC